MKEICDVLILGAGFSGLSVSYHIGHEKCVILEKNNHPFGHCSSHHVDGIMWDEGPHVSFTKSEYVKELFAQSVHGEFVEYDAKVGNYYHGSWIDHPAQVNLYQVPEPIKSKCLDSFITSCQDDFCKPSNYADWLAASFGKVFAQTFPAAYTRKYWTCDPKELETSWVGERVYQPNREDVLQGSKSTLADNKHYIENIRYPKEGGYASFGKVMEEGANIRYEHGVQSIDLEKKNVVCANGAVFSYKRLISTMPLPLFVKMCKQATASVKTLADQLSCTSGYLINVVVPHPATRPEHWIYVYDESKLSTRITFSEKLDGNENLKDFCAIQVEVYHSKYRNLGLSTDEIRVQVIDELYEMGLIDSSKVENSDALKSHIVEFKWGNVIFDHKRKQALNGILEWLTAYGLVRENDDLEHDSNWEDDSLRNIGDLVLAGRFGQWKYYWSDDCVLRGKKIGKWGTECWG